MKKVSKLEIVSFVYTHIKDTKKVHSVSARELSHVFLFGKLRKPLSVSDDLAVSSLSKRIGRILTDLCKNYPKNIYKVSARKYVILPDN